MLQVYILLYIVISMMSVAVYNQSAHNLVWEIISRVISIILILVTIFLCKKIEKSTNFFIMTNYLLIQVLSYLSHQQIMKMPEDENSFVKLSGYLDATFNFAIHSLILCSDFKSMIVCMISAVGIILEFVITKDLESKFWRELLVLLLFEFFVQGPIVYYILQRRELKRFYENKRAMN